jgi:N4-gp56 family major capsid protein
MNRTRSFEKLMAGLVLVNLQLFAEANTNTTGSESLSPELRTFYDKALIRLAEPNLIHDQFGQKRPIPKNGGQTVNFRRFDSLPKAMTPLTEGVTPNGQSLKVTSITAAVSQYGGYVTVSDILDLTAPDPVVVEATKSIAGQASRSIDTVVRNVLNSGTNVLYAGGKTSRSALTVDDKITPELVFRAATILRAQNAPTINGGYVAIIHPYVAYDLMRSSEWIDVNKYSNASAIFNGEIGKLGGVRFVQTSEARILKDDTCPASSYKASTDTSVVSGKIYYTKSGDTYTKVASPTGNPSTSSYYEADSYSAVFSTLFLGANAYGSTEITGGGLEHIVKPRGSGEDPLNQRATVGWKATKTAEILVEQYILRLESCSTYSSEALAN